MSQRNYTASLSQSQSRVGWSVIFRHPLRLGKDGKLGLRVRRGLSTSDPIEAQALVEQMNDLLSEQSLWSLAAKQQAEQLYSPIIVDAFYDGILPTKIDHWSIREQEIPLPSSADGYARVLLLGTTGAGKTTLVRQLIGTNPRTERFPSTSASKTTVSNLEIVLAKGPVYQGVVSFFDRSHIRQHIEECVVTATVAAVEKSSPDEIERKLLEHSEQRFRLSYLLGTLKTSKVRSLLNKNQADELPDELTDEELTDDLVAGEQQDTLTESELTDQERQVLLQTLKQYLLDVQDLAQNNFERLARNLEIELEMASEEELSVLEELLEDQLEDQLYESDDFHSLVDRLFDDVESRFNLLVKGELNRDETGWPRYWVYNSTDRRDFIQTINRFSSNYASNFGKLLTPLVEGIRVAGPFTPSWYSGEDLKIVIMDGEGLGHTQESVSSISTNVTKKYPLVDVVLLVDNAAQPMQAAPAAVLRSLVTSGYYSKLVLCFTHFDEVKGDNLPNLRMRKDHVLSSYDNAAIAIGASLDTQAENVLKAIKDERIFFLSNVHEPVKVDSRSLSYVELGKLLNVINRSIEPSPTTEAIPSYDMTNVVLSIQTAAKEFHERWRAILALRFDPAIRSEHWTRVKALSRRIGVMGIDEYDSLRPVADMIRHLKDHLYLFLQHPLEWQPSDAPVEIRQMAIDAVTRRVDAALHELVQTRLIGESMILKWSEAYSFRGRGSVTERAYKIRTIYDLGVPVPNEIPTVDSREFVKAIRKLVQDAIIESGGKLL